MKHKIVFYASSALNHWMQFLFFLLLQCYGDFQVDLFLHVLQNPISENKMILGIFKMLMIFGIYVKLYMVMEVAYSLGFRLMWTMVLAGSTCADAPELCGNSLLTERSIILISSD